MVAETLKEPGARVRLRAWIQEQLHGETEVHLPDVVETIVQRVIKDRAFLKKILLELLRPMVYEEARRVIAESRVGASPMVQLGDDVVSKEALAARARRMTRKWLEFTEHAGARYVLLMDMTADDLTLAEAERRRRGDIEHGYADLWAKLRARLEPGQCVRDMWTAEEIDSLSRSLKAA